MPGVGQMNLHKLVSPHYCLQLPDVRIISPQVNNFSLAQVKPRNFNAKSGKNLTLEGER